MLFYAGEFIVYRMGASLALFSKEPWAIRPVQGIPSGLVSHVVTAGVLATYGDQVGTMDAINAYAYVTALLLLLPALTAIVLVWLGPWYTPEDRLVLSAAALVPWYALGSAVVQLIAPEYWLLESGYSLLTVAVAVAMLRSKLSSLGERAAALVGAWAAIGLLTKAPAAASVLILVAIAPPTGLRAWGALIMGGAVTVCAGFLAYALGNPVQAAKMLAFAFSFFASPNASSIYSDAGAMIAARPQLAALAVALCIGGIGLIGRRPVLALAAIGWALPYIYLVLARLHDTSVTSAATTAVALVAFLILALPNRRLRIAGCVFALVGAVGLGHISRWTAVTLINSFIARAPELKASARVMDTVRARQLEVGGVTWYMPSHFWSGVLPAGMFAWSGNLAPNSAYPRAGALARHFGPTLVVYDPVKLRAAWDSGSAVSWAEVTGWPQRAEDLAAARGLLTDPNKSETWTYSVDDGNVRVVLARRNADVQSPR